MSRKPQEQKATPLPRDAKMTDEARREIFGKSELETAPDEVEGRTERARQYSGASESGAPDSSGSERHS